YELRNTADYMIATQSIIPNDGIPYDLFLAKLVQDPGMSAIDFAREIMSSYITLYNNDFSTLTLCDLTEINELGKAFCDLTKVFEKIIGSYRFCVSPARDASEIGLYNAIEDTEYLHDLFTFFDFLVTEKVISDDAFQEAVEGLKEAMSVAVVEEVHSHRYRTVPHGLSFWFPPSATRYTADDVTFNGAFLYEDCGLDLISESSWVACMMEHYTAPRGGAAHGQKEKKSKR
ncbi:MAG: clostripain-related cysteine peptidase, partial [Thermodesulfobacteriota bacterium]|nr:clostripain-related cysteine peptidase [Thermodesulfobacteriota bacterium]